MTDMRSPSIRCLSGAVLRAFGFPHGAIYDFMSGAGRQAMRLSALPDPFPRWLDQPDPRSWVLTTTDNERAQLVRLGLGPVYGLGRDGSCDPNFFNTQVQQREESDLG